MKLYENLAEFYDLLYDYRDYDSESGFLVESFGGLEIPRLLDIGCGTGSHLAALRRILSSARLVGIDLSEDMLNVARRKNLRARLERADMRDFNLGEEFDLAYCFSSSLQYNLFSDDLERTFDAIRKHIPSGLFVFDLAYCQERWMEGYTNITTGSNEDVQVAELFTSHSKGGFASLNSLYLVKNNKTGKLDMQVDSHTIRLWSLTEIEDFLKRKGFDYELNQESVPRFTVSID